MADIVQRQANFCDSPRDSFPYSIRHQQDHQVLHTDGILPAITNGQLEHQWRDVPLANGRGPQLRITNQSLADYPDYPGDSAAPCVYPSVGVGHSAPEREQFICPENRVNGRSSYTPQGVVEPSPPQAAFPGSSVHLPPALGQPREENLRRLANRYVQHPGAQIDMVLMEPGSAGRYQVVIILEVVDLL